MKLYAFVLLGALTGFAISASSAFKAPEKVFKDLAKRQQGDCTEQEAHDFWENDKDAKVCRMIEEECGNNSSMCDVLEVSCTGVCLKANLKYIKECDLVTEGQAYRAGCGRGPSNNTCATDLHSHGAYSALIKACPSTASSCSDDCKQGIEHARDAFGCCLNNYINDSVVAEYLGLSQFSYLVNYTLWSECGVPTDIGFCYGSAWAKSSSAVFGAALIAVLVSLVI